jgi:hemolysin activation/secretion protein
MRSLLPFLAAGLVLCAVDIRAQTAIPGSLLPGQVERQFHQGPVPRPAVGGPLPAIPTQPAPPGADTVRFPLRQVDLEGNTRLPPAEVQAMVAPYLQREVSLADLYVLADALTARYRNGGYLLSQVIVPAQAVADGQARLQAVEGYIAAVRIDSPGGAESPLIARYAERIRESRPLTAATLERYMLLINDLPGVRATATLVPSGTEFGAADLVLQVTRRQWNAGISIDNRGGKALGDTRLVADGAVTDLLGRHENTGVKFAGSPGGELAYLALQHEQQLGDDGGKLSLGLTTSRALPKERSFVALDLETRARGLTATYQTPWQRSRRENLFLRASLTAHDGEERVFGIKDRDDRLRVLRAGVGYDLTDAFGGANLLDLEASQGLNALGASRNGDPLLTRPRGRVDFRKLTLFAARIQDLAPRWSLLAALQGQYAFDDLLASELYGFGGDLFGRGYAPSELVGDHGAAAKLELRHAGFLPLPTPLSVQAYAYWDTGTVRQRTPVNGQPVRERAASAGIGARLFLFGGVSLFGELSKPLDRTPTWENNRSPRAYVGLSARI